MKVSRPEGVPRQAGAEIPPAQGLAPSAASAASASASAAGRSATVSHPPRIPLHMLGAPSAAAESAASAASPTAGLPPFSDIHNDPMGIVTRFLPPKEQILFRTLNSALKGVVERNIEALMLTPDDAVRLFNSAKRLPNLKSLHLSHCDEAGLRAFAATLSALAHPRFVLSLDNTAAVGGPIDLACLASLNLSALSLNLEGGRALGWRALASAEFPIAYAELGTSVENLDAAVRLPNLTRLSTGKPILTHAIGLAIQTHPSLTEVASSSLLTGLKLQQVLGNAGLQSLEIDSLAFRNEQHLLSLTNHPSLGRLKVAYVDDLNKMTAIANNPRIATLDIGMTAACMPALKRLADMPLLRALTLVGEAPNEDLSPDITVESLHALCQKPLDELNLKYFQLDTERLSAAASAMAKTLSLYGVSGSRLFFDEAVMDLLVANPHIAALKLGKSDFTDGQMTRLAASATIEKLTMDAFGHPDKLIMEIKDAWDAAGKSPIDLVFV